MRMTDAGLLFMVDKEPGETIESIAEHFGTSPAQLYHINSNLSKLIILGGDVESERDRLNEQSGNIFIPLAGKAKDLFEEHNMGVQRGKFKLVFTELTAPDSLVLRVEGFEDEAEREIRILSLELDPIRYTNLKSLDSVK